jgi:hypothetical protein
MAEKKSFTSYLKDIFTEVILIVIGVLLAIQVDGWMEEIKNENTRKEIAKELKIEFQTNLDKMDVAISFYQKNVSVINSLLIIIKKQKVEVPREKVESLIRQINNYTYDPINGILNRGMISGDILFIKNEVLKKELFSWEAIAADSREEQDFLINDYFKRVNPFIERYIPKGNATKHYKFKIPDSHYASNVKEMLQNQQFENILMNRLFLLYDAISELEPLKLTTIDIINNLEKELNNE